MLDRLTIERSLRWAGGSPVLLALSGGGDSVALLHLLVEELGADRVRAAVVDHALRLGSDADAQRARVFAESAGISATILTLSWAEGASRGQQAVRRARYAALCAHARAEGLSLILAAHTADDQAETVLMRAASGSGWRGLAGMAAFAYAPLWPEGRGIALARPLLGARRAALREYLRGQGADWIEDPANANTAYERVRIRARLLDLEAGGFDPLRLVRVATRVRARADALDRAAQRLIGRAAWLGDPLHINRETWSAAKEVRLRALAVLMAAASGARSEVSAADLDTLEARVMATDFRGATYAGVALAPVADGVALARDPGAVLGRADGSAALEAIELSPGETLTWDGRIEATAHEAGWSIGPARNARLLGFAYCGLAVPDEAAGARVSLRTLAAERIAHAFTPDINAGQP